jgi:hypothetical protein
MKTNYIYLALILFFIILGCNENDPVIVEDPPEKMLELSFPLVGDNVHYCCFSFEWDDPSNEEEYRIQIAKFSSFNDPLLDTIVTGTTFEFPSFLEPRGTYNWRVTALDSETSQKSEFKIIDYADYLRGTYEATLHSNSWLLGQGSMDTTHQTTLKIWKGDDHSMAYKSDHSAGQPKIPFSGLRNDGYVLYSIDFAGHPSFHQYIKYYFDSDSIVTYSESSGNGGGGYTRITAVRN